LADERIRSSGAGEIIAVIKHLFELPTYGEAWEAQYDLRNESATAPKMRAGKAPFLTHELAHHLIKIHDLTLDPVTLSSDVRMGFRQFDFDPSRGSLQVGMEEGFSEWLRRRETDHLQDLTWEQQAAADYAEEMLASRPGVTEKLNRVRHLFREFGRQPAAKSWIQRRPVLARLAMWLGWNVLTVGVVVFIVSVAIGSKKALVDGIVVAVTGGILQMGQWLMKEAP